ncbi:MAG TPA: murein biosynthesis integral membrane protein MurJ [Acidimicrobiia bacterium]|nr:murein biosynthesis integral membrane protein MurJ [Acidimicrobiia bacterium]
MNHPQGETRHDTADRHEPAAFADDQADAATTRLVRSSVVVGLGTVLSRITGFLRVSAIAAIGFDRLTDVYNVANSTPNIVYELLLGGILTATLVPLYVEYADRRDPRAADAINTVAMVGLLVISVLGVIAAPWIIKLYTLRLDTADRASQQALATALLRLFMPQIFFYGVTALLTAMLNARRRFAAAAFAPALNNVIVIGVFLAVPRLSTKTLTVANVRADTGLVLLLGLGTTAGIVAMALVLWPALRGTGARLRFVRDWRHPAVRQLARLSGWTIGYVVANQLAFWVALFLAYGRSGDASVYLAAFILFQLPHGLFAVSIMTALGPELAARANRGDLDAFRREFSGGLRLLTLVVLPASGIMVVLARPIVTALLRYGDFTARSASLTAETLAAFGIGLLFFSLYLYTLRAFYAMQDTRTPFLLNCFENGLNIVLALALYPSLGVQGLALSWSIAYFVASVLSLLALRRKLGRLDGRRTVDVGWRIAVAAALATALAAGLGSAVGQASAARAIVACALALTAAGVTYLVTLRVLGVRELALVAAALTRRRVDAAAPIEPGSEPTMPDPAEPSGKPFDASGSGSGAVPTDRPGDA